MKKMHFAAGIAALIAVVAVMAVCGVPHDGSDLGVYVATAGMAAVTEADLKTAMDALKGATDEVKKFAEQATKQAADQGKLNDELRKQVDEALVKHAGLTAEVGDLQQKLMRRGSGGDTVKTLGQSVVDAEPIKKLMEAKGGRARVSVNADDLRLGAAITSATGSAGDLVVRDRQPQIIGLPQRRMTVRDLLTPGQTQSNMIEYVKETGFTNLAAVVSEGATKPESAITFSVDTAPVRTIAHWVRATKQILDDAAQLRSYIDQRLRYGLAYAEELELLKGSGAGQHIEGIVTQATAYSAPFNPAGTETLIDVLRLAMLQAQLAEFPATGIVLHPTDWTRIELLKDGENRYLWANPRGNNAPGLWGLPVVTTQAMDLDEFLVGAFRLGAQIFDREEANVEISTEDNDNFVKNLVTIRAEERLALAVYRPEAFITGDFGNHT